ncbi:hypothetical protein EVAR_3816_1 [Eumeta japonica]|uniref:Uncharacterized protein n=1 Tax=Eumeta variegata TaxID=151549 RepID=A0A4C1SV71_EUMVA|nr:hypothetical protein EVAR_3816_1 [Eumeta japonica]
MFSVQSALSIKKELNRALARVHCWGVRNKLKFAPPKINSMVLTKKLKYDDPVVHMNGEVLAFRADPLVIRVREATWLYEVKCRKDLGDNFVDRQLERPVYFGDLHHPAHVPEIGYESVEDLDSQTMDAVVGPQIYTDGSQLEGKVGTTPDGTTERRRDLVLDAPAQSFLHGFPGGDGYGGLIWIRRVKNSKDGLVNIFSVIYSSLEPINLWLMNLGAISP